MGEIIEQILYQPEVLKASYEASLRFLENVSSLSVNTRNEPIKEESFLENRKSTEFINQKEPEVKSETTVSHIEETKHTKFFSNSNSHQVGIYSKEERKRRIAKYRLKVQKFLKGENKNKDRYILRSKIAKAKPRIGGKFAKKFFSKTKKGTDNKQS